jgi:hypothetical protein
MARVWKHMLEWLNKAHADPTLFEAQLKITETDDHNMESDISSGSHE